MSQTTKPSPCASKGHIWVATSSPLIDRCTRAGCHAMRQYKSGAWTEPQAEKLKPAPTTTQQPGLWA